MAGKRGSTPRKDGPSSRRGKEHAVETAEPAGPKRALQRSRISNEEAVDKVRYMAAAQTNECGANTLRPGSTRPADLAVTEYPFFVHTLFAGLVPPFSSFFLAVLEHYQIHPLHLHLPLRGVPGCEALRGAAPLFLQLALLGGRPMLGMRLLPSPRGDGLIHHPHEAGQESGGLPDALALCGHAPSEPHLRRSRCARRETSGLGRDKSR